MNPSDTGTFVIDDSGNLLLQFHSDKTATSDIQDNSTLAQEGENYKSYIDKSNISDDKKHLNICQQFVLPPLEVISGKKSENLIQNFNNIGL